MDGTLKTSQLRFALPPALGSAEAFERARGFADHLTQKLGVEVVLRVSPDYESLRDMLLLGETEAIWAPPFVCARLETKGLPVAVRGVRGGVATYRAALVCSRKAPLTLAQLQGTRAAWVDPDSVAGHLLAQALLKSRGLEPAKVFREQKFHGSYREALLAVDRGDAEVTSIFAPPGPASSQVTNIADVLPDRVESFSVVAFSEESPNDGVVLSRKLSRGATAAFTQSLLSMHASAEGQALLTRTFRIDRFEAAPAGSYRSLYKLAMAAL